MIYTICIYLSMWVFFKKNWKCRKIEMGTYRNDGKTRINIYKKRKNPFPVATARQSINISQSCCFAYIAVFAIQIAFIRHSICSWQGKPATVYALRIFVRKGTILKVSDVSFPSGASVDQLDMGLSEKPKTVGERAEHRDFMEVRSGQ